MPCLLLIVSQSVYLIQVVDTNLNTDSAVPDHFTSRSQLIKIYTICKGRAYLEPAGPWLKLILFINCFYTPGNLVRGRRWLSTQNLYVNFWPWLTEHPNVNKRVSSPDLLIFSQFHRHIFEKSDNAIPSNFHFYIGKDRCGLGKTSG